MSPSPSDVDGLHIGIDFGTTNSSIAVAQQGHGSELVAFPTAAGSTPSFRSVLYMEQLRQAGRSTLKTYTGPAAIEHYLAAEPKGRLIQSLKSYLASRTLTGTEISGRRYTLEDLIARILADLRLAAEAHLGQTIRHATVGRPVRFVGAETPEDDAFAEARLRAAFLLAGFDSVTFDLEPVAAARAFQAGQSQQEATILIGDFGGGTSDFSLLHLAPGETTILGNAGLGLAGDAFDARIVRELISPVLGSNSFERSYVHAADRPANLISAAPVWIYRNLERWHYLSFLKTRNVTEILRAARLRAQQPDEIAALITLIDEDLGYQLHQAVQRLKIELSRQDDAVFQLNAGSMNLAAPVTRADFERWIAPDLNAIVTTVDGLLASTGIGADAITSVFLTGGTSLVPAVRRIFESRFTPARIHSGNEFTSVATGLAMRSHRTSNDSVH